MKSNASEQTVLDFLAAVFPDAPHLAQVVFDEEHVLRTATAIIKKLRCESKRHHSEKTARGA